MNALSLSLVEGASVAVSLSALGAVAHGRRPWLRLLAIGLLAIGLLVGAVLCARLGPGLS